MRRVGQTRRRDATEPAIVNALERIGVVVWAISGKGVPDLLTFYRGQWLPIEVKSPGGKLTSAQIVHRHCAKYPIVESVTEALALFGVYR